jgi:multidrug resistance protein MdtO
MMDWKTFWDETRTLEHQRLARATLITLLCATVVMISKSLSLPETALSAYLIFFASKEESTLSIAMSFGMMLMAFIAFALFVFFLMLSAGTPLLRVFFMFTIAFVSMYLARTTTAGTIFATLGMIFFELLSLLDYVPSPDILLRGLVWIIPIVVVPMAVLIVGNLIFGRSAITLLSEAITDRLHLIRQAMDDPNSKIRRTCRDAFQAGNSRLEKLHRTAVLTGRLTPKMAEKSTRLQESSLVLLGQCAEGSPPENTPSNQKALAQNPHPQQLQELANQKAQTPSPPHHRPDHAVSSKESIQFAIKATLSIAICYGILLLLHWPAIHTITITAFLVSLGSTSETLHKASLRLIGCLIGAVISLFCIIVIIPHLSHAAELAILTAVIAFPAAWISVGSEKFAYIGMQIALVFFLSVLNTNGPSVDVSVAWGRIVGIVLGNLVVAGVYLTLWPQGVSLPSRRSATC